MGVLTFLGNLVSPLFGWLGQKEQTKQEEVKAGEQKEVDVSQEQTAATDEQKTEFASSKGGFLSNLADFLNRMPRFLLTVATFSLIAWAPFDPVGFSKTMTAFNLIPEWLSAVFLQEFVFYFGDRIAASFKGFKGPDAATIKATLGTINELRGMNANLMQKHSELIAQTHAIAAAMHASTPAETDAAYREEMTDTTKPLSNAAIAEWNRRRMQKDSAG
jgi:hypothetical protein